MKILLTSLFVLASANSFANLIELPENVTTYEANFSPTKMHGGMGAINYGIFNANKRHYSTMRYEENITLAMTPLKLSDDGTSLEFLAVMKRSVSHNQFFLGSSEDITLKVGFKPHSCEDQSILGNSLDLSSASIQEIMNELEVIEPAEAFYCDLIQTSVKSFEPLSTYAYLLPRSKIRIYKSGRMELYSSGENTSDISFPLTRQVKYSVDRRGRKTPIPDETIEMTPATFEKVNKLTNLIKDYGRIQFDLMENSAEREIAARSFIQQHGEEIKKLRKTLSTEVSKFSFNDLFSVLTPINKAYAYVKALEKHLKSQATIDTVTQSWGN